MPASLRRLPRSSESPSPPDHRHDDGLLKGEPQADPHLTQPTIASLATVSCVKDGGCQVVGEVVEEVEHLIDAAVEGAL